MKKLTLISAAIALSFTGVASANHDNDYQNSRYSNPNSSSQYNNSQYSYSPVNTHFDKAKVVKVQPIYDYRQMRYSEPRQRCWTEYSQTRSNRKAGSVIGGIIGGVIGNKIGQRRGHRGLSTVAGAVIGSTIGKNVSDNKHRRGHQVCETVQQDNGYYDRQRITGYDVTYKYKGKRYNTVMDYDPGRWLPIEISIRPRVR